MLRNRRPLSSDLARQVLGTYRMDGAICEHHRMMFDDLLNSPFDILIFPVGMILLFVVILIRMYVRGSR